MIPITELTEAEQLRYYRSIGAEAPEEMTPKKQSAPRQHKALEEFSADEREEIAEWIRIIHDWEEYCAKSKLQKVAATDKFVQLQQGVNLDMRISKGILYRKKAALKADNLAGLLDNRGGWRKGTSSIPDVAWECFMSFYLDEAQHPIAACLEYTEMWLRQEAPQYLPLPSYASFYRRVQNEIPEPLEIMGRQGMKAFRDRCAPYIQRTYENMVSNEWWIADNHTFDVMTSGADGKVHRLYLTAFFDARSGIFTGCYVTSAPSSQATLIALRKGIIKYGMADTMQDNLQGQITILKSSLEGLGIEIYEGMQEPLKDAAVEAQGYVNHLTEAFTDGGLTGMIEEAGNIFGELAAKAADYAPEMVEAAIGFLNSFVNGIAANSGKLIEAAKKIVSTIVDNLVKLLPSEVQKPVRDAVNNIKKSFENGGLRTAINTVKNIISNLGKVITSAAKVAVPLLSKAIDFLTKNTKLLVVAATALFTAYKSYTIIKAVTAAVEAHTAACTAAKLAEAAEAGAITLKQIAVGLLTGEIGLATATQIGRAHV